MKIKILDLNYGKATEYEEYLKGLLPSHPLYGMIEIEKRGYEVKHVSMPRGSKMKSIIQIVKIILKSDCNVIFFSYIYIMPLLGIALLKKIGFYRNIHFIGISHTDFHKDYAFVDKRLCRFIYRIFDCIFFHSPKNLEESIASGFVDSKKLKLLHWGIDLKFLRASISNLKQGDYFISTGRENRDFPILIDAFSKTNNRLKIYTNVVNYENNYVFLEKYIHKYPNVEINLVEKGNVSYLQLAELVANSLCVVVPLVKEACYYCLGHTSIVEALALGKPIIISANDYHPVDVEEEHVGIKIKSFTSEEWIKAILYLNKHPDEAALMGENARRLADEKYNINICADEILNSILEIFEK